jgi:hypothetical protein
MAIRGSGHGGAAKGAGSRNAPERETSVIVPRREREEDRGREFEMARAEQAVFEARRWEKASAQKRAMPRGMPELQDPGPRALAKVPKRSLGTLVGTDAGKAEVLTWARPARRGSFGFIGVFATVASRSRTVRGTLVLRFDPGRLGYVSRDSLHLFRYDDETKQYVVVADSAVSNAGDYVYGSVAGPGRYAIIGVNTHPVLYFAARVLCETSTATAALADDARNAIARRICQLILCAPDLWNAAADPAGIDRLTTMLTEAGVALPGLAGEYTGPLAPGGGFGPVPVGGVPRGICEECARLPPGGALPECQIIPRVPGGGSGCRDPGWSSLGPRDLAGCVKQVTVDPSNPNRIYCAASNGGIWRLADVTAYPGTTWQPLSDQLENLTMSAIAVAPSDPQVLYAANALQYLYRSGDAGAAWARTSNTDLGAVRHLLVHPSDAQTVFVASSAGFRVSFDGGGLWQMLRAGDITDAAFDPDDHSIIYLAERNTGVLKSTSFGFGPWTTVLPWARASAPSSSMIKIALGRRSGGSAETDTNRTVVAKFGSEVFVNHRGGRDIGTGWVSRGSRGGSGYGDWCHVLAVDPFDSRVILAGQQELYRTGNDGVDWSLVVNYYAPHEDQQSVCFDPAHPNIAYLSNDGGVFRSTDGGQTWQGTGTTIADEIASGRNLNLNLVTAEFYRVGLSGLRAVANLYHSGIIATTDVTTGSWSGIEGHAWEFNNVYADPKRPARFYVFGGSLMRRRYPGTGTGDFAQYGAFRPHAGVAQGAIAVDTRAGSSVLLAGADDSAAGAAGLFVAPDGDTEPTLAPDGVTWTNLPAWAAAFSAPGDSVVAIAFAASSPGMAYAITAAGRAYVKNDVAAAGAWSQPGQWAEADVRHLCVDGTRSDYVYAISATHVGRSRTGGTTWSTVATAGAGGELPDSPLRAIVAHPGREGRLYVAAEIGVYASGDGGDHWVAYDERLPNAAVQQLYWSAGWLYAVTHGRGLWRRRPC